MRALTRMISRGWNANPRPSRGSGSRDESGTRAWARTGRIRVRTAGSRPQPRACSVSKGLRAAKPLMHPCPSRRSHSVPGCRASPSRLRSVCSATQPLNPPNCPSERRRPWRSRIASMGAMPHGAKSFSEERSDLTHLAETLAPRPRSPPPAAISTPAATPSTDTSQMSLLGRFSVNRN